MNHPAVIGGVCAGTCRPIEASAGPRRPGSAASPNSRASIWWMAFPTLFDFGEAGEVPKAFQPTCHIFYGQRVVDMADGLPKWSGHKNASEQIGV